MKFNLKQIALGSLAAVSLLATTQVAFAEGGHRGGRHLEQLNLTEAQSSQIEAIRENVHSQMESVLTAEQRATLESSDRQGRRAWRSLDLTDEQRSEMRTIRENSRGQVEAILTDDQRQQLEEMHEGRGERQGRGNRGSRQAAQ